MGEPAVKRATYEDLLTVPETMIAEIVDGVLHTKPRPASPHANAASVSGSDLVSAFHRKPGGPSGPGGWWILDEPELHLGGDILVPDLAGWRRERLPVLPDAPFLTLAPDWLCEVASPSTARFDRMEKMAAYAREGAAWVWLVDPSAKLVEVYRLEAGLWVRVSVHGGDERARMQPFDAIEIDLERWWLPDAG
jgi:Uma2 family endonuclease